LAFLILIGFDPLQTFIDVVSIMFDFFSNVLKEFWDTIKDLILPW